MKFLNDFLDSERNKEEVKKTMRIFIKNPKLARGLAGLYQLSRNDIDSDMYNPYYDEMKKMGITATDIKIFQRYICFDEKMREKENAKYRGIGVCHSVSLGELGIDYHCLA